jgi:two-component system NtrC family sensor kinase
MVDRNCYKNNETVFAKRKDASGTKFLCVTSMLKNIDWIMVFRQNINDAFADLWKTQLLALIAFIFGCVAILSVAFLLPKNIVKLISKADTKSEAMNKQVVESGKLATIGELAAGIAHEINNPVAIMVEEAGWIGDLLEEEDLKECENLDEFTRALEQINTQGRRCKEITHKLLSFARKTDTTINDVQVNEVIKEMVSLTDKMAMYNNVTIETDLHGGIPYIRISPSELQQVILNLINNAIDAMDKTGGKIKIVTKISAIEKNNLVITMEDNGPGIPKDNLGRIFDPFFTTKAVGKGTGLGLSICYGIIQKMSGKIDVHSQVGVGTKFRIWIPFQEEINEDIENEDNKIIEED